MKNILIIGSNGQIGTDLLAKLRQKYPEKQVWASDIREPQQFDPHFVHLDATDAEAVKAVIESHNIGEVYIMAAILSANAEKIPLKAWDINMQVLFNILELGKQGLIDKIFWPSSIAVFGPHTPRINTPQYTIMDTNTVYGISKLAGERWVEYYKEHYKKDKFIISIFSNETIDKVIDMVNRKYNELLSKNRRILIIEILKFRFNKIKGDIRL